MSQVSLGQGHVKMHKLADLLPRYSRLRRLGNPGYEIVRHTLVDIQLHLLPGSVKGLVEADETAEQDLFCAALYERRRKSLREITVDRRRIGMLLMAGVGVRSSGFDGMHLVAVIRLGVRQSELRISRACEVDPGRYQHGRRRHAQATVARLQKCRCGKSATRTVAIDDHVL